MPSALEKIGQILVGKGVLTQDQFDACLREHTNSQNTGKRLTLGEIVVSHGYSQRDLISKTLEAVGVLKFTCIKCRKRYSVDYPRLDASYVCRKCGGALECEDIVPSSVPQASDRTPILRDPPSEVIEAAKDPKRKLGKYTLLSELGRGGYAVVYKAWDDSLQHYVALKLIRTQDIGLDGAPKDNEVQEFLREARTAVKLSHPNIVRVFELGHVDDRHFLSMELIDGASLAALLRQDRERTGGPGFYANPEKFLAILREVALALDHAHRQSPPIVHRDIKPQNILVANSGRACVVDFGLAKELRPGAGHTLTLSGIAKGTPCYMAPEQALAKGNSADPRTDVYALGAILYEYLTGQPPFIAPSEREILNKVISEEPIRPSAVLRASGSNHVAMPDLEHICMRALEKEKENRYATAQDFAADLNRFLAGEPVEARAIPGHQRALRWARRRPAIVIATSAAIAMGIVSLVVALRGRAEPERVIERVVVQDEAESRYREGIKRIDSLTAQMKFEMAIRALDELLAQSLDGSRQDPLLQWRNELSLQLDLLKGLVERIRKTPRDYQGLSLADGSVMETVRVLDATADKLIVRNQDRVVELPWSGVSARQFLTLIKDYWPEMDGRASLALGVWCLRHGFTDDAALLFSRPASVQSDPQAQKYRDELAAKAKHADLSPEEQMARILGEAESALTAGDYVVARARFERALTLVKDEGRAITGLQRVAELERQKEAKKLEAARTPVPEPPETSAVPKQPDPTPPNVAPAPPTPAPDIAKSAPVVAVKKPLLTPTKGLTISGNHPLFSPDGKTLATQSPLGLSLWDVITGKELRTIEGIEPSKDVFAPNRNYCFSPDGLDIVSWKEKKTLHKWRVSSGECTKTLDIPDPDGTNGIVGLANLGWCEFTHDGQYLVAMERHWGGYVLILRSAFAVIRGYRWREEADVQALYPDSNRLLVWVHDRKSGICTFNLENEKQDGLSITLESPLDPLWERSLSLDMSRDGRYVAGVYGRPTRHTIKVWDAKSGRELKSIRPGWNIRNVRLSPKGDFLLATSEEYQRFDGSFAKIQFWTSHDWKPLWKDFNEVGTGPLSISKDGTVLAVASESPRDPDKHSSTGTSTLWELPVLPKVEEKK